MTRASCSELQIALVEHTAIQRDALKPFSKPHSSSSRSGARAIPLNR